MVSVLVCRCIPDIFALGPDDSLLNRLDILLRCNDANGADSPESELVSRASPIGVDSPDVKGAGASCRL